MLLLSMLLGSCVLFYLMDGHTIVKNNVVEKYQRFRSLNRIVETKYKGFFMVMWVSFSLIFKSLWLNFLQYTNNSIKQIDKNKFELSYVQKGLLYKIVLKTSRIPPKVLLIFDEAEDDVTDLVLPYLGPCFDCHGQKITPSFFNRKTLTFELTSGETMSFDENEEISLKNEKITQSE